MLIIYDRLIHSYIHLSEEMNSIPYCVSLCVCVCVCVCVICPDLRKGALHCSRDHDMS